MAKIKNAWEKYDDAAMQACFSFNEEYKKFISSCKSERE